MRKGEKIKIAVDFIGYLLLSWLVILLYDGLGIRLIDFFKVDKYVILFQEKLIPLILILIAFGGATSLLLIALRHFHKKDAILLALMFSILAVLPGFFIINYDSEMYYMYFIFYIIGIVYVASHISDEKEDSFVHSFGIGYHYLRKIAVIAAVGALIGSYMFISSNIDNYESSFSDITKGFININNVHITRDQVKTMLEAQSVKNSPLKKEDFKEIVDALYTPLSVDEYITLVYPTFDQLDPERQKAIRESLTMQLNSKEYQDNLNKMKEEKLNRIYNAYESQIKGQLNDKMIDDVYNRLNSKDYQEQMMKVSESVIKEMPVFKTIFSLMPLIISLTIFSILLFVELLSSFVSGLVFILHWYLYKRHN